MDQRLAGQKGGRTHRRPYRFSMDDIANAKGKSVAAVRKDRQRGKFDPYDLLSLVRYLTPRG